MFNFLKEILFFVEKKYLFYVHTKAFQERYMKVNQELFVNKLSKKDIDAYIRKWSCFGVKVEINTFLLCYNLSGKLDYNIVPENIFASFIEPSLNKYALKESSFLAIKNIYEKWFKVSEFFPKSYFHKIDNIYYDRDFNIITNIDNFIDQLDIVFPIVCKPSLGTAGGDGVYFLKSKADIRQALNRYSHLVFQEKIYQNSYIDKIHSGISSIRSCLYRDDTGKFKILNNSIRFGINGGLDNVSAGGLSCKIDSNGRLNSYAISKYCEKYSFHPNSNIYFSDIVIPCYSDLLKSVEKISNEIPLCNLISLDMCLDINNNWRCLEINLYNQTIRFAQYAGEGFFNEYTDDLIKRVVE
ncbi:MULTISPECIES: sugar-transfer associated ATP-grasp domain-containing protein [Acinetobacter]|uniref:sugar-transfer associated ATP-grasp domain-containing protein n=1 Tax=Acinetobacter TaxID=469 RepID=UPI0015D11781|nr:MULTISPECIES: sugar-transfer associated ATP-grasp domain-containing protein [Acinetobacter]